MLTHLFHLHALSALHVGVGQAVGAVDLPIARSRATHLPLVPGSALKGVLRDELAPAEVPELFGPERIAEASAAYAGALAFGDAHLLLLPVRSLAGVCAFVTCPFVLGRYAEDCRRAGLVTPSLPAVASPQALLCRTTCLEVSENKMVLEDLDLHIAIDPCADDWADLLATRLHPDSADAQRQFRERLAILADDDFSFLADTATEIRQRIRIDDARGVVEDGALWSEENLPAETVLWGVIGAAASRQPQRPADAAQVWQRFVAAFARQAPGKVIQLGGKATSGRGLVRCLF